MKRLCLLFYFICMLLNTTIAQPQSIEYKKQDFLLAVLANPTFSLCDFKDVGLDESNTSLENEALYVNTKSQEFHKSMIRVVGKDDFNTRKTVYKKVAASWRVFKEIQYRKECVDIQYSRYDIFAPKIAPELRHKLSIVPLKLVNY